MHGGKFITDQEEVTKPLLSASSKLVLALGARPRPPAVSRAHALRSVRRVRGACTAPCAPAGRVLASVSPAFITES